MYALITLAIGLGGGFIGHRAGRNSRLDLWVALVVGLVGGYVGILLAGQLSNTPQLELLFSVALGLFCAFGSVFLIGQALRSPAS